MLCSPASIFVGLNITIMYSKADLEISSRTNILLEIVLAGYQIDKIDTITMKDTSCMISSTGDTACEIIETYNFCKCHIRYN